MVWNSSPNDNVGTYFMGELFWKITFISWKIGLEWWLFIDDKSLYFQGAPPIGNKL